MNLKTPTLDLENRKPVWLALSDFYLDTELQASDFRSIAATLIESPYSWEELRKIDKYELFPVLQPNLLSVAGEWAGFNEAWLVGTVSASLSKRNALKRIGIELFYFSFKWMCKPYWKKLKLVYGQMIE